MMNKKQAVGLMVITLIFVALIGLTMEQRVTARSRAAEGMFGGAASGALIGGLAGGGRGAAIGAGVGAGVGLMAVAAADERAYEDDYGYDDDYYEPQPRRVRARRYVDTNDRYFDNDYYSY